MNHQSPIPKSNINKAITIILVSIILGFVYSEAQLAIYGYKSTLQNQLNAYERVRAISSVKEQSIVNIYNEMLSNKNSNSFISKDISNGAKGFAQSLQEYMPRNDDSYHAVIKKLVEVKNIALITIKIFYSKMIVILMSLPLFLMTGCVGLVDGLSRREIRTAELGRESSYVFHRLSGFVIKGISILIIGWLILPINIMPSYLFLVASLVLMMSVSMASSRFKKYL